MSEALSQVVLRPSPAAALFAMPRVRVRPFGWSALESEMGRAFGAIREYASIAWWDGSAIGLHLHGVFDLFDLLDAGTGCDRRDLP